MLKTAFKGKKQQQEFKMVLPVMVVIIVAQKQQLS